MGKHSITRASLATPVAARGQAHRLRSRTGYLTLSFAATFGFLLVNVIDPYSGAVASPDFHQVGQTYSVTGSQTLVVAGDYDRSISRDTYKVKEKPKPPPPPPAPVHQQQAAQSGPSGPHVVPDPGSAQAYAKQALAARGFGDSEFQCLVTLWNRESGWRVNAYNASSGAYGIPQALPGSKMASVGSDWRTNAATQIDWGLGYVLGRYGSPCAALAHSNAQGWY